MKKVAIEIEFDGKKITTDYKEYTEYQMEEVRTTCEKASSGDLLCLELEAENKEYYIPKQILERSVISLIYFDE
jgi:hypothetical protein